MTVFDLRIVVSRLEPELRQSLENAVSRAVSRSHPSVDVEHWLAELIEGAARPFLRSLDVPADRVAGEVAARLDAMRGGHAAAPALSRSLLDWIEEAWLTASLRFGRDAVAVPDLFAALTSSATLQHLIRDVAPSLRLDDGKVAALAKTVRPAEPPRSVGGDRGPATPASQGELERYTLDLTAAARDGRLDPVVGREAELRQVIDILLRRRQNNPILTGEAGVGKTAVVEALALRIAAGTVPAMLRPVTIRSLDLGLLQAGAGVKGEFERRLTGVISEIKAASQPVILFIDEAHVMIGAGNQAGGSDAANLLKPALARGELRTIAATTWAEYKRHIERDPALTRRFQVVKVGEPSQETAVRMLRGLVPSLEKHHGVRIRDEALVEAVRLSARHLPDRQLPDKAISVLDTAAAGVVIGQTNDPAALEDLEAERAHLDVERASVLRDDGADATADVEVLDGRIAGIDTAIETLQTRLAAERAAVGALDALEAETEGEAEERLTRRRALEAELASLQGEAPLLHRAVGRDAVAAVVARWTGVPVGRLVRDSVRTAMTLEDRLRERVVGQDGALAAIAAAMRNATAGLADPRKPPGVFLMVGTSGIGKTETALALADQLYGGPQHLTIINMSEFKEEHKVSSLVGSPPGYVGYGEGGVLTEAVRRRPYGLLLLDEMEKAHPGVQDVFYQVFDKGQLRDGEGRDVEFLNTTIIMTSNAGAETLAALAADPDTMPEGDALVAALQPELAKWFKPAFLGRVTIVPYVPLSEAVLHDVARLQVGRIRDRMQAAHGVALTVDPEAEREIVGRCLAGSIGARAIEGVLTREVLPRLSDLVLEHALSGARICGVTIRLAGDRSFTAEAEAAPDETDLEQPAARLAVWGHHDPMSADDRAQL